MSKVEVEKFLFGVAVRTTRIEECLLPLFQEMTWTLVGGQFGSCCRNCRDVESLKDFPVFTNRGIWKALLRVRLKVCMFDLFESGEGLHSPKLGVPR